MEMQKTSLFLLTKPLLHIPSQQLHKCGNKIILKMAKKIFVSVDYLAKRKSEVTKAQLTSLLGGSRAGPLF